MRTRPAADGDTETADALDVVVARPVNPSEADQLKNVYNYKKLDRGRGEGSGTSSSSGGARLSR